MCPLLIQLAPPIARLNVLLDALQISNALALITALIRIVRGYFKILKNRFFINLILINLFQTVI